MREYEEARLDAASWYDVMPRFIRTYSDSQLLTFSTPRLALWNALYPRYFPAIPTTAGG